MFWRTNQLGPVIVKLFNGLLHLISVTMTMIQPHKMSDFLSSYFNLAWEKSRHFATLPLISTRNDVLRTSPVIPYWWCIRITTQDLGSYTSSLWNFCARFSEKNKNKNKTKTKQTKKQENKGKKTLNYKKKNNWETSSGIASFSAQANINWTLHVLSHAPANSSWRSDGQILDLKQHVHGVVKLDSLTVSQTKHLVVIQNSVHIFDPQSVHRSVTHNPLVIFSGVLRGDNQKRS